MGQRFIVSMIVDTDDVPTAQRLEDELKNACDAAPLDIWIREITVVATKVF